MPGVRQKFFDCSLSCRNVLGTKPVITERIEPHLSASRSKIFVNSLVVVIALSSGQVQSKVFEINGDFRGTLGGRSQILEQESLNRIGSAVEPLKSVSGNGFSIAVPQPKAEGENRPDERNEGRVGVEKKYKFTQGEVLFLLISQVFVMIAGMAFSRFITPRRIRWEERWMRYHTIMAKRWKRKHPKTLYPLPRRPFWLW